MLLPLLSLGTLPFFVSLVFLLIPFVFLEEEKKKGILDTISSAASKASGKEEEAGGNATLEEVMKAAIKASKDEEANKPKEGMFGANKTFKFLEDIFASPLAPLAIAVIACCICCCCIMILDQQSAEKVLNLANNFPIIGESMSTIGSIYIPMMRVEMQESGLGPYLIEQGPFGEQGYFNELWTVFQNPWVLEWETAEEEEINPVYDRGIILDDLDMIPSQPLSDQRARIKITVRNTEQDVSANHIQFFVENNELVDYKTGLNFYKAWEPYNDDYGNCYYEPCDPDDEDDEDGTDYELCAYNNDYYCTEEDVKEIGHECKDKNMEVGDVKGFSIHWADPNDKLVQGQCCEVCDEEVVEKECDKCLDDWDEAELKDYGLPPHLQPLDTVSLVATSKDRAHTVREHGDVSAHTVDMEVAFQYQFEPQTNIFCTDARGMSTVLPLIDTEGHACEPPMQEFDKTNEKEMSAYTFTILEPGDYTDAQLLDWETQLVNYIAGGPVKAHVIHRKNDVYYRENPIFIHYKIENKGADTDATEMVYLNPQKMRIIIPEDLLVDPESEDFLACKKIQGLLPYAYGDGIKNPWVCIPEIWGECTNYPKIAQIRCALDDEDDACDDLDDDEKKEMKDIVMPADCDWEPKSFWWLRQEYEEAEQGQIYGDSFDEDYMKDVSFYEGGSVEIPFQIDTINAKTDKEYTISLIFLGEDITEDTSEDITSAYRYRLTQKKVIAVQPVEAETVE